MLNNNWSWHSSFQRLPLHLLPKEFFHSMHLNHNLFYPFTIFLHSHFLHPLTTLQSVCWGWSCLPFHHSIHYPSTFYPFSLFSYSFYLPTSFTLHKTLSSSFLFHLPFPINIFKYIILNPCHIMIYLFKEHYLKSLSSSRKFKKRKEKKKIENVP